MLSLTLWNTRRCLVVCLASAHVERSFPLTGGTRHSEIWQTCESDARRYTIGTHKAVRPCLPPPSQLPFLRPSVLLLFCLASFVLVFITARDTKKASALVWKRSHLQSFTLTKTAFYHYNTLRQWHISAAVRSERRTKRRPTRSPFSSSRSPSLLSPHASRCVLDNEKMLISFSIRSVLRRLIHIIQHCADHNDGLLLLI